MGRHRRESSLPWLIVVFVVIAGVVAILLWWRR
jgi:hypothetical protein